MTYSELLIQKEWFNKCRDILQRDYYHCQNCGCLGYHDNSYYECDTAVELDKLLNGILIDGNPISFMIDKVRRFDISKLEKLRKDSIDESHIYNLNNKLIYDLKLTRGQGFAAHERTVPIICDYIIDEDIVYGNKYWWREQDPKLLHIEKYYMPVVTCFSPLNWIFQYGGYSGFYLFKKAHFKNYSVMIEKRWPTGIVGDQYGYVLFGHVVVSICYQNCCVVLYFYDQTHYDNDGKYLETPIIPKGLNVHHKYYVKGKAPWEYENDALITLCQDCHGLEHKTKKTPVYRDIYFKDIMGHAQICDRCGGSGYLPQYMHVEGGVCFKCYGEGVFVDVE